MNVNFVVKTKLGEDGWTFRSLAVAQLRIETTEGDAAESVVSLRAPN